MSPEFLAFLPFVLDHEGREFENDPEDPGGATKFGIDQRDHPGIDIVTLTMQEATAIYWQEWLDAGADHLPYVMGCVYFDEHVNAGPRPATIHLQAALNARPSLFDPVQVIAIDGVMGPATRAAAWASQGSPDLAHIIDDQLDLRAARYRTLAESPRFIKFLPGWLNRAEDLRAWATNPPLL